MKKILSILSIALIFPINGHAQKSSFDMTLEELMNVTVTTASRQEEKAFESDSAVYVITSEDIRRSGVTSIPEALRMAPGVQVARID